MAEAVMIYKDRDTLRYVTDIYVVKKTTSGGKILHPVIKTFIVQQKLKDMTIVGGIIFKKVNEPTPPKPVSGSICAAAWWYNDGQVFHVKNGYAEEFSIPVVLHGNAIESFWLTMVFPLKQGVSYVKIDGENVTDYSYREAGGRGFVTVYGTTTLIKGAIYTGYTLFNVVFRLDYSASPGKYATLTTDDGACRFPDDPFEYRYNGSYEYNGRWWNPVLGDWTGWIYIDPRLVHIEIILSPSAYWPAGDGSYMVVATDEDGAVIYIRGPYYGAPPPGLTTGWYTEASIDSEDGGTTWYKINVLNPLAEWGIITWRPDEFTRRSPVIPSGTSPLAQTVTASSNGGGVWAVFDDNTDTGWISGTNNNNPEWIQIDLGSNGINGAPVNYFEIANLNNQNIAADFKLLSSNDGASWVTLTSVAGRQPVYGADLQGYYFHNAEKYRYYRLVITGVTESVGGSVGIGEFALYTFLGSMFKFTDKAALQNAVAASGGFDARNVVFEDITINSRLELADILNATGSLEVKPNPYSTADAAVFGNVIKGASAASLESVGVSYDVFEAGRFTLGAIIRGDSDFALRYINALRIDLVGAAFVGGFIYGESERPVLGVPEPLLIGAADSAAFGSIVEGVSADSVLLADIIPDNSLVIFYDDSQSVTYGELFAVDMLYFKKL